MISQCGVVEHIDGSRVWVVCERRLACDRCERGEGCGGGVIARLLGSRPQRVRARTELVNISTGDRVRMVLPEYVLLEASFIAYLLPVLLLLLGAVVGSLLFPASDLGTAAGALGGLALGLVLVSVLTGRAGPARRFEPEVVERLG